LKRFEGVITAIVTPLNHNGELKENSIREIVDFQVGRGIHGLFPLGTLGEGIYLPVSHRKRVAELVIEQAKSKIPVIIHIGAAEAEKAVELAKHAGEIGADAVCSVAPIYYRPDAKSLIEYFKQIAKASKLPVFIYNNVGRQGYNIDPKLFGRIASEVPEIVGVKDTSYNVDQITSYIQEHSSKYIIMGAGDSMMLINFALGAAGHVCAVSNIFPELTLSLYKAVKEGNIVKARELQFKISSIRNILKEVDIAPYKAALKIRGIDAGYPAKPLRPLTDDECKALLEKLKKYLED